MSVIVSFGADFFNEKINEFEEEKLKFQAGNKKNSKRKYSLETKENFEKSLDFPTSNKFKK